MWLNAFDSTIANTPHGFIREQQKTYPVTVLCRVMEVSNGAFYNWLKTPEDTDKVRRKAEPESKARQLLNGHRQTYGHRRLSTALGEAGMKSGRYQVRRSMARSGSKARYPKRFKPVLSLAKG